MAVVWTFNRRSTSCQLRLHRMTTVSMAACFLAVALCAPGANAAPGDLDSSFAAGGVQITDFGGQATDVLGGAAAADVAVQVDGKLVVVGSSHGDFALARYNRAGSLDRTFSGDGMQTADVGGIDGASAVALQPDGKLIVVGVSRGAGAVVARFRSDGSLDTSFAGDGKETTDFGSTDAEAADVAVQADGKIVVVGSSHGDFALARYNRHGLLDRTFSGDGKQTTDIGDADAAHSLALQPDGRLVVAGVSAIESREQSYVALARYNRDGSLDRNFSKDGKRITNFGHAEDDAAAVAIQADGKIVVAGRAGVGAGVAYFGLARYTMTGSLDHSFSSDGKQTTGFGGEIPEDDASGVAIQADGKIVAVGTEGTWANPWHDFALARYDADGSLDTGFSGDGMQTTDVGGGSDIASGVALQPDGKLVVVGSTLPGVQGLPPMSFPPAAAALASTRAAEPPPPVPPPTGVAPPTTVATPAPGDTSAPRANPHRDFALARYQATDATFVAPPRIVARASSRTVNVSSVGVARLKTRVQCPGAGPSCLVHTRVTATLAAKTSEVARRPTIRLGGSAFTVAAGTSARVKVTISRMGRRLLRRRRRIAARASVSVARASQTASRRVKVTLAAR